MLRILLLNVFHSKFIDDQTEADGLHVVLPQTGSCLALAVTMPHKPLLEKFLGNDAGLGQAVHSLADLAIDEPVGCGNQSEIVVLDDIVRHV
jgi:hypothetical protein